MIKKLGLLLALLMLIGTQGAFANSAPNTYPACYQGYGVGDPLYNGTNGDKFDTGGWCIDDYGVLTPKSSTKDSTHPNTQGGSAQPMYNTNVGTSVISGQQTQPTTYDALIAQQTGSNITDFGGYAITPTIDTLAGTGMHYVLPPAYPGEVFTITSASKSVITVDALTPAFAATEGLTLTTADQIEWAPGGTAMTSGQNIKSPGFASDSVTLYCPSQGIWMIKSMIGTLNGVATQDTNWTVISTG